MIDREEQTRIQAHRRRQDRLFTLGVVLAVAGIAWMWLPAGLVCAGAVISGAAFVDRARTETKHTKQPKR